MNKKRLLIIGPEPPPATGMEIATQSLLAELRRESIDYVRVDTADPIDVLGNRGAWTAHNVRLASAHLIRAVRKTLGRGVSAVYVPIAQDFPALLRDIGFVFIALAARRPVIVHLHGGKFCDFYASQKSVIRLLLRLTIGRAAIGIVLTERLRPALECVIPSERVRVVANGIDMPTSGDRRIQTAAVIRVLFLSSLYRWKGPLVFIQAFARAHKECSSLRATVAGDWPSDAARVETLRLARELDVEEIIQFPGPTVGGAKRLLFESADIFCFASLVPEGQPLVILEAMAAGLPVVAPAWPGIADTVVDGVTGLLVSPGSARAFADALGELARDPARRVRLGAAGRQRYERFFTQNAFGARMLEVVRPFVEQEPTRPPRARVIRR